MARAPQHHRRFSQGGNGVAPDTGPVTVDLPDEDAKTVVVDPASGSISIEMDDGGIMIDLSPQADRKTGDDKFDDNLAKVIDDSALAMICADLLRGVEADDQSRSVWLATRTKGIELLGLTIERPTSDSSSSSSAVEGQSTVRHPLLLDASLRFNANARGELLPTDGPVKIEDCFGDSVEGDDEAELLEKAMNFWFTKVLTEYYPDTDQMLFMVGVGGLSFKKVYHCPIRRRPVSESVDAKDLIISSATTDIKGAVRVTHRIMMKPSTLRRMQIVGAYRRTVPTPFTTPTQNIVERAIARQQGVNPGSMRPEDADVELYEIYCELDIPGFKHKIKGESEASGLAVPYRVVIDKEAQQILEVRRNWLPDDDMCFAKTVFVKYPFAPGLGFYSVGLINILGNSTMALTAAWRMCLDSGMFANFPGFLYAKAAGRQLTNDFRVAPGTGTPIDTAGGKLSDTVMALPYKDVSSAFIAFLDHIAEQAAKVGGTAEMSIGEGRQDAPVGTTLALIEQAMKVIDAVHKRLHTAQAEEFALMKELLREDPGAFLRAVQRKGYLPNWNEGRFIQALNNYNLSPQADPNTPSHMHRLMKATALAQLAATSPQIYDIKAIHKQILKMVGFDNVDQFFLPDGSAAAPDPKLAALAVQTKDKEADRAAEGQIKLAELAAKAHEQQVDIAAKGAMHAKEIALDAAIAQRKSSDLEEDRKAKERLAALNVLDNIANHPDSSGVVGTMAQRLGALPTSGAT